MAPSDVEDRLPWDVYLAVLKTEVERMLEISEDLDASVPNCPGWTVRDLLEHVARVFRHKVESIRTASEPPWPVTGLDTSDVRRLLADESAVLLAELQQRGPRQVRYTWYPEDRTNGFWFRRMALEATMHRVDAEQAAGAEVGQVESAVAQDGIDEFLTVLVGGPWWDDEDETAHPVDAVVVVRTDERAWTVDLSRSEVVVTAGEHDTPDLTVEGHPHDIYLWLWGRGDATTFTVDGRKELLEEVAGRFAEAGA
ncbi:maleylpyruvate isomerase family mycothiol-dependent enzyme [Mumia zhuanghuii]|uniref:Maleylpyruvate isomerase family mycothiol-dependent enzyme n=2 Tax=Mumia TaxID=1546255 RepID=A0ABW1QI03_9ACTN|nr:MULTISPECIES: maleylpyruvate isomerase family mycothiol-dependent enzyme [Mumia]KAA1422871.1 maleylpyruvate isomerase family mycothiol-dependent enzyme [Mumia zhuanghuii]